MEGHIVSLNTGTAGTVEWQGKAVSSAIHKVPVNEPIWLATLGFTGDVQVDTVHHGGEDKAVCVYCHEHYAYWEKGLGISLPVPTFGENITTKGMTEKDIAIGDVFQLGEAVIQISQPRMPCFKVAAKLKQPFMVKWIQDTGFSGYYVRVLQEGHVAKQDVLKRIEAHSARVTVDFVNKATYIDKDNTAALHTILSVPELAESWRTMLEKRV
ncbi:hypothetical protein A374_18539 [Fictibacillus macauensis ZFHKF-1]|uniref:MOSC domain-containing protein n=1 Tax=Fictibacillus macauensis ZFHKF-1 TaxID=1196324 RepID=I8AET5_9BACL|nr:MOSC domain-containing protein [Fictibacillus macauensis]EIT83854.1 hypothetical protein A374_18539 [Fictibacillus macauensis ZFHKF-1]